MSQIAVTCIALAVYFESRGEPEMGQRYVAHTVINRSKDYDDEMSACRAVFDEYQFSWTVEFGYSKSVWTMIVRARKHVKNMSAWKKSIHIARVAANRKSDITGGVRYFNEKSMGVRYKTKTRPKTIGNHIFY